MYVLGSPGSTVNVTIIDSTITACSAVAQTTLAVSAWHAAQQGEGSRVLGGDRGDSTAARACAFDWWGENSVRTAYICVRRDACKHEQRKLKSVDTCAVLGTKWEDASP